MLKSIAGSGGESRDGPVRWKLNLTLPSGWKRSVGRLSDPYFHYLPLGLVSAAVVVAAFFSAPHRPQKPEKPEQPMAVAVTPPPPDPSFNTLPSNDLRGKRTLFDPNPSSTLRHSEPDAIPVPETPDPGAQIDVRRVLKLMNAGVTKYASGQDEANRAKGAKLIQIAALLGYQTARNLIVVNYPRAASVRAAVTAPDVILYGMDLFLDKRPEAVTVLVTLANYFSTRGEIPKFAKVVIDVLHDDSRLSDAGQVDDLFKALSSVRGVCSAIKHEVLSDPTIGENDCSDVVQAEILAHLKGLNGLAKDARDRGVELMRRTDAAP
jgi:hypothetical protein